MVFYEQSTACHVMFDFTVGAFTSKTVVFINCEAFEQALIGELKVIKTSPVRLMLDIVASKLFGAFDYIPPIT